MQLGRIILLIKSRSSSKLGHVGLNTRLFGQIIEKPCVLPRGHSFDPKYMALCHCVNPYKFVVKFETGL